ncbi:hypothetical protein [Pseudomonas sp. MF6776]|uniref:hypothetical protein n=1 Tax=Pseudomonas sp. MF6776 TaxID=2797534 RepID=UPI00190D19C3|nr:hypothetical protein [Pseudomonas sp. MF6776]MBK3463798.1 hypothetical protein [Pseudomonas sp. MF6776]
MLLRALLCEIKGLKPEAKYFLVRFIQCFGVTDVCLGVKDLAKQVGVTDRQVSEALDALVAAEVLIRSSIPNGRGRPARCHGVAKTFLAELNRLPVPLGVMHEAAIERLMVHVGPVAVQGEEWGGSLAQLRARKKPGSLNRVNRLLMAVLLCGADRFGVVRNLGTVQICKATGLSKEKLRSRLKTLMAQELIRSYLPGLSSPVLSVKRKSVYYLNLNHAQLVGGGQATSTLGIAGGDKDPAALALLLSIRSAANRDEKECAEKAPILKVLAGQGGPFYRTFQALLEGYAAQLLSRHWLNLKNRVDDLQLRQQILRDFRLPAGLQGVDDIDVGVFRAKFNDQLFNLAYDMALWLKCLLSNASNVPLCELDFVIVPQPVTQGYFCRALLALPKAEQGWNGYLMMDASGTETSTRIFAGEQDIPLEERYAYGLLSRPGHDEVSK